MIKLPIDEHLANVTSVVREKKSVIILAEPGAGKTTRVPVALASGGGKWIVLQPRRWATKLVADRIAEENNWTLGKEVGFQVRFESKSSRETRVLLMTEGVLLRRLIQDPELREYQGVILDEFHERSLDADLALSMLREIQESIRDDLKIVVMSATMDPQALLDYLPDSELIQVSGRVFPVERRYLGEVSPSRAIRSVLDAVDEGDVLYFLPGAYEIQSGVREIQDELDRQGIARDFDVLPLYSSLAENEQKRVFASDAGTRRRKIILSTNIAETSITLPKIRAVVDSGWAKVMRTDPQFGQDRLETLRISSASADQRAGRAGRVGPGFCFRLWTDGEQMQLRRFETPEVHRVNLSSALLMLNDYGVRDFDKFFWFEKPKKSMLEFSLREIRDLGFLNEDGVITERGRRALRFPLAPRLAGLMLASADAGVLEWGSALCAWLEQGRDGTDRIESMDALLRQLDRLDGNARRIADQLYRIAGGEGVRHNSNPARAAEYFEVLIEALSNQVFVGSNAVGRRRVVPLKDRVLSKAGILLRSREKSERGQTFIQAMAFVPLEIAQLQPHARKVKQAYYDHESERVRGEEGVFFKDLALGSVTEVAVDGDQAFAILVKSLQSSAIELFCRDENFARWWKRMEFFARHSQGGAAEPNYGFAMKDLLEAACFGKTRVRDVAEFDARGWIEAQMDRGTRQKFEEWVPEKILVPSGGMIRVDYDQDPPKLSVRLQELFGLAETPKIAGGKVAILMELLSPGFKPMQLTRDLKSFWNGAYFEVKKELKAQYPKHSWPDDPWTAPAIAKGRRRQ
ncbi:MAG: ATP-dependent helicase HrpB [Bdellovibrionales bacterium]|nr:ATP-dependent helicase HrpB [Bdellovibrionales bacterium]